MVAEKKKSHDKKSEPDKSKPAERSEQSENRDEVAEASWESFPASDPPSWTMRQPGQPTKKSDEDE
jgi:hypothetical protein